MKKILFLAACLCSASFASNATDLKTATKVGLPKVAQPKRAKFADNCHAVTVCGSHGTFICYTTPEEKAEATDCLISDWCGL